MTALMKHEAKPDSFLEVIEGPKGGTYAAIYERHGLNRGLSARFVDEYPFTTLNVEGMPNTPGVFHKAPGEVLLTA